MSSSSIIAEIEKSIEAAKGDPKQLVVLLEKIRELSGLTIEGYIGDYPTFIEPVYLKPGVKIGDTVLLGPNVYISKECVLGDFTELTNTILLENVRTGKYTKLKTCVVDSNITLPVNFKAQYSFITKKNDKLEIIKL